MKDIVNELTEKTLPLIEEFYNKNDYLINDERCCYVFVYGKKSKKYYSKFNNTKGAELVWVDTSLPFPFKWLSNFVASEYGLLKITNFKHLENWINDFCEMSMFGLFSFNKQIEDELIFNVKQDKSKVNIESVIKKDSSFYYHIIDGDSYEYPSGICSILNFGESCPEELKKALSIIKR